MISEITEGEEGWKSYDVLPRLARALGTHFNSDSEMERGFFKQSDVLCDTKRNKISHSSLDANMQMKIKYGVESAENCKQCEVCLQKKKYAKKK